MSPKLWRGLPFLSSAAIGPNPGQLSNLVDWADGTDIVTIGSSPVKVNSWPGRLGAITPAQAVDADRPLYNVNPLNGKATSNHTATGEWLFVASPITSQPFTIWTVIRRTVASTANAYGSGVTLNATIQFIRASDYRLSCGVNLQGGTPDTNWHLLTSVGNGVSSEIEEDDVSIATGDAGANTLTGLTLGALSNGANPLQGDIAAWAVQSAVATAADRELMKDWANAEFALAIP